MMQKNNFSNKNMKLSHSRVSLSGIFDARRCSYEIGKTLFSKRQLRRRSRTKTFRDDSLCFYERQTAGVEDPGVRAALAYSGMTLSNKQLIPRLINTFQKHNTARFCKKETPLSSPILN